MLSAYLSVLSVTNSLCAAYDSLPTAAEHVDQQYLCPLLFVVISIDRLTAFRAAQQCQLLRHGSAFLPFLLSVCNSHAHKGAKGLP